MLRHESLKGNPLLMVLGVCTSFFFLTYCCWFWLQDLRKNIAVKVIVRGALFAYLLIGGWIQGVLGALSLAHWATVRKTIGEAAAEQVPAEIMAVLILSSGFCIVVGLPMALLGMPELKLYTTPYKRGRDRWVSRSPKHAIAAADGSDSSETNDDTSLLLSVLLAVGMFHVVTGLYFVHAVSPGSVESSVGQWWDASATAIYLRDEGHLMNSTHMEVLVDPRQVQRTIEFHLDCRGWSQEPGGCRAPVRDMLSSLHPFAVLVSVCGAVQTILMYNTLRLLWRAESEGRDVQEEEDGDEDGNDVTTSLLAGQLTDPAESDYPVAVSSVSGHPQTLPQRRPSVTRDTEEAPGGAWTLL